MSDLNRPPLCTTAFWARLDSRIQRQVRRIARPLRGVLQANVDGSKKGLLTHVCARADDVLSDIEYAQHFGFRSIAPKGLEVVLIPISGSSAHLVAVATIDRATSPPSLVAGESALYSTGGATVVVRVDGSVELNGTSAAVARVGDSVQVTLTSDDIVTLAGSMVAAGLVGPPVGPPAAPPPSLPVSGSVTSGSVSVRAG